ncbi:hypothetical protein DKP78_24375, partial [Enterococcus faecium]
KTHKDFHRCITRVKRILFWKKKTTKCDTELYSTGFTTGSSDSKLSINPDIVGGQLAYANGLKHLDLKDPEANHNMFRKWA